MSVSADIWRLLEASLLLLERITGQTKGSLPKLTLIQSDRSFCRFMMLVPWHESRSSPEEDVAVSNAVGDNFEQVVCQAVVAQPCFPDAALELRSCGPLARVQTLQKT